MVDLQSYSPQSVLSGHRSAVERAVEIAKSEHKVCRTYSLDVSSFTVFFARLG